MSRKTGLPIGVLNKDTGIRSEQRLQVEAAPSVASFSGYRSQRVRAGDGYIGSVLLTADDWKPGLAFQTPIGRIFAPSGTGHVDIYQIQISPFGNRRAFGPRGELSPARTEFVHTPYSITLHGMYDPLGRHAGTLDVYPVGGTQTGEYVAWPDVNNFWAYDWFGVADFSRMPHDRALYTEELSRALALALTHWVEWEKLPERIEKGAVIAEEET